MSGDFISSMFDFLKSDDAKTLRATFGIQNYTFGAANPKLSLGKFEPLF